MAAALVAATSVVLAAAGAAEMRTWTASAGGYQVRAEMLELSADGIVALRALDGRRIEVLIDRLSPEDQKYARGQVGLAVKRTAAEMVTAAQVEEARGAKDHNARRGQRWQAPSQPSQASQPASRSGRMAHPSPLGTPVSSVCHSAFGARHVRVVGAVLGGRRSHGFPLSRRLPTSNRL